MAMVSGTIKLWIWLGTSERGKSEKMGENRNMSGPAGFLRRLYLWNRKLDWQVVFYAATYRKPGWVDMRGELTWTLRKRLETDVISTFYCQFSIFFHRQVKWSKMADVLRIKCAKNDSPINLLYYWYCDARGPTYYHIFILQVEVEGVSWYTTRGWVDMKIVELQ